MELLSSLSIIIIVTIIAANLLLGYIVYGADPKSTTSKIFILLNLVVSIWSIIMYLSLSPIRNSTLSLTLVRGTLFFAVLMNSLFFLLAHTIPSKVLRMSKKQLFYLIAISIIIMIITISPYTFTGLEIKNDKFTPTTGPGIALFGFFSIFINLATVYILQKRSRTEQMNEGNPLKLVMIGILIMFGLIILTIFIPVVFFQNSTFVQFFPLYIIVFLGLTAYAIVRHKLFNVKVIATEAFTALLGIILFAKIIVANSSVERIVDSFIFITVTIFGTFLIKSVRKEVEQREQLEILTKELGDANEKLKALDVARAEFISIASHQLRTPPATVKWFLSAILSGDYGELNEEVKTALTKTQRTNNSLISLIEDMLNVSRIERGTMEFLFEEVDTLALADLTYETLLPIAGEKKLSLEFHKPAQPLPMIMADKEKLRQVMNNLIDNALKYTKQGSVQISLFEENGNIRFQVKDTGKGINPEEAKSIFEKFKRGRQSIAESAGLGLGLYVAKVIIEQHKGKLWAESEGEGKGSTFIFTIPIKNDLKKTTLFNLAQNPHP